MRIMLTSDLHGTLEGLNPKVADVVALADERYEIAYEPTWVEM